MFRNVSLGCSSHGGLDWQQPKCSLYSNGKTHEPTEFQLENASEGARCGQEDREIRCKDLDWIKLAADRLEWRDLLDKVINYMVP
jgi:hypothetical protein